jgi:hypothetical protein
MLEAAPNSRTISPLAAPDYNERLQLTINDTHILAATATFRFVNPVDGTAGL